MVEKKKKTKKESNKVEKKRVETFQVTLVHREHIYVKTELKE